MKSFPVKFIRHPSNRFRQLLRSSESPESIRQSVTRIIADVKKNGDDALLKFTRQFDGLSLRPSQLRVPSRTLEKARAPSALQSAARETLRQVQAFARASLPQNWSIKNSHGATVGEKFDPLRRIGIYIPGGSVPLVSSVFMTVAIARVAGVRDIAVCSPPPISEPMLWALKFCGATEVFQMGGAQAIAAMAHGTRSLRPVDKIFGPGNAYVTEAKRQVFGFTGVDLMAGPSELMVIADSTTHAGWAAADLLAQAEHGTGRERIFCVSTSLAVLEKIQKALLEKQPLYPKNKGLSTVLAKGTWFIQSPKPQDVANEIAPEHLQIMTRSPEKLASKIHTAGGIFLGNHTPTVLGDFVAGPSHTLPTAGAGRSFSGLRVTDFMRRTSLVQYSPAALKKAAATTDAFARAEQLPAHGNSLKIRLPKKHP